ncbi:MAG TPA: hypothetical protein VGR35_05815 [Tepidisphaeraceae bacterium]|nr:hypothetical protein [Tepidisphaeraceae bacterium]
MAKHFYRIDFHEGAKDRMLCGSSPLDPAQLMTELASTAFIRLDDLFYRDNQNRFRSWSEWDPRLQPTAFINCKCISTVMPFVGDPRDGQAAAQ